MVWVDNATRGVSAWMAGAVLVLLMGCNASTDSGTCERRLITGKVQMNPDGSIEELNILIQRSESDRMLAVLARGKDQTIVERVVRHIKDISRFHDDKALLSWRDELVRARGRFFLADLLVCRGKKEGILHCLEEFTEIEKLLSQEAGMTETRIIYLKVRLGLIGYVSRITDARFRSAEEFAKWLKENIEKREFDMSGAPYIAVPPALVPKRRKG